MLLLGGARQQRRAELRAGPVFQRVEVLLRGAQGGQRRAEAVAQNHLQLVLQRHQSRHLRALGLHAAHGAAAVEEEDLAVAAAGHQAVAGDPHGADDDGLGRALAFEAVSSPLET